MPRTHRLKRGVSRQLQQRLPPARRRAPCEADGMRVPCFVWFQWQCRSTEELQLCWDSLHRIVYGTKGLCDVRT